MVLTFAAERGTRCHLLGMLMKTRGSIPSGTSGMERHGGRLCVPERQQRHLGSLRHPGGKDGENNARPKLIYHNKSNLLNTLIGYSEEDSK